MDWDAQELQGAVKRGFRKIKSGQEIQIAPKARSVLKGGPEDSWYILIGSSMEIFG